LKAIIHAALKLPFAMVMLRQKLVISFMNLLKSFLSDISLLSEAVVQFPQQPSIYIICGKNKKENKKENTLCKALHNTIPP